MMFSIKASNYQGNTMLNICDAKLLGQTLKQDGLDMKIAESYYGERIVDETEAADLLKNATIINMVGEKTISLSTRLGIGSEKGARIIAGVPFLIVFKV
ncbi:MAG: DUF424 domain-containing protein [Thaumarchaeota archaeon]|nr:DUF424 domain-containing protein [Nitrososphaerota archaeon]